MDIFPGLARPLDDFLGTGWVLPMTTIQRPTKTTNVSPELAGPTPLVTKRCLLNASFPSIRKR